MGLIKFVSLIVFTAFLPTAVCAEEPLDYPLTVKRMFDLADQYSSSVKAYELAGKMAEESVRVVKNDRLPSLTFSASASYLGDVWIAERNFSGGHIERMPGNANIGNNFALEASYVVYAGGAVQHGVKMANLQMESAHVAYEQNRQNVRFLLIGNYLELYKLYNQKEVYLKNIEQTKVLLKDMGAKQKEGLALRNDITRYELQLKSLELELTQIENGIVILNNRLVTTLHLPENANIIPDSSMLEHLPVYSSEEQWQDLASIESPLLKLSQLNIERKEQHEKIVKSDYIPSFVLFAGDKLDGPLTFEIPTIDKNLNYWYVGLGMKYNIGSLYTNNKKMRTAKLSTQHATEEHRLQQENVSIEVKSAYTRFAESFTIYETQVKSLELAMMNYDVVNKRYLNDLALITDMLDASNSKLNAELQLENARINILYNYYQLQKAAGIL